METQRRTLLELPERLDGERVAVRPFEDADAPAFHAAIRESIEHVRPWLPWYDGHKTVEDTLDFIRRTRADFVLRESFNFGVFDRGDGQPLGGVGLGARDWQVPSFEIGYWLRASAEGKGYMQEAVRLVTALAFETLGAQRVMIRCDQRNVRSQRVAERLGYVREGCLRNEALDTSGRPADMVVYSLIPEEFGRDSQG
jgi:RimJ/RimL family protein N-acetyltransferase